MEHADEDNGAAGSIPQCGAIFMANSVTKKECLRHRVFALPSSMTGFLKHVKTGMVLFLFEYEKRKLFGVYQAISDGAMDIVPRAFHRLGKHFPAQVSFRQIWNCYPLSENEFRDAITENYFSAKKFNFGLSENQVHRLLLLFSAKLKIKLPTYLETEPVSPSDGKDRHLVGGDLFLLNKETYMEPKGGFHPSLLHDYEDNSFCRVKNTEFSINRVHKEKDINSDYQGALIDYPDDFLTKKRRLDNDGRLLINNATVDGLCNSCIPLQFTCTDSRKESLNEEGRLGDSCRGLTVDWVGSENQVDKNLNPVLSADHVLHPWDIRMTDGGSLMHRNRFFRELNTDITFGEAFETECFEKPSNDCMQTEYSASNAVKLSDQDLVVQARKVTNDHKCSTNMNFENRYHVRHDGSFSVSANPCNLLHKVRKMTAGGNLPINERIEREPNFCTSSRAGSENFANPLLSPIHSGEISIIDRKATEITLSPAALKNSKYIAICGGRIVDDDRFRKRNRVENLEDIDKYASAVISSAHPSLVRVPKSHDPSFSTFDYDTKAFPYVCQTSFVDQRCSPALEVGHDSFLVRENLPYHSSLDRCHSSYTNSSLPYFSESKTSRRYLDIVAEFDTTNSCLKSKSSMPEDRDTPASVGYRGSLFFKHSEPSVPYTGCENIGIGKRFPSVDKSNEHHYGLGGSSSNESHMSEHVPSKTMNVLARNNFLFPEENYFGDHVYQAESDLRSDDGRFLKMSRNMNLKEHQEHSEAPHLSSNIRRSVFTRLTSDQCIQFDQERNENHFNCQDCNMAASADEIMEMLHKSKNLPCSKLKSIRMVGQHKDKETSLDGKQMKSHVIVNQLIIEKKILKDAHVAASVEDSNKVPKETRIVDFKRRSKTKKTLVRTGTTSVIKNVIGDSGEAESSAKKIFKRKRLVRPIFMENELAVDNLVRERNTWFPGLFLDKDDEQHFESAICTGVSQITNDDSRPNNVLSFSSQQSTNTTKENTNHLVQKGTGDNILSWTHHGLKDASLNVDLENGSSKVTRKDTSQHRISCIQTPKISVVSRDGDTVSSLNLPKSSADGSGVVLVRK